MTPEATSFERERGVARVSVGEWGEDLNRDWTRKRHPSTDAARAARRASAASTRRDGIARCRRRHRRGRARGARETTRGGAEGRRAARGENDADANADANARVDGGVEGTVAARVVHIVRVASVDVAVDDRASLRGGLGRLSRRGVSRRREDADDVSRPSRRVRVGVFAPRARGSARARASGGASRRGRAVGVERD